MLYNNFGLDTYTSLVLLDALRQQFAPEYYSPEPVRAKESLLGKACRGVVRRLYGPQKSVAPQGYDNITSLNDACCRVQGGEGKACDCPEPVTETCALPARKKAV